MAILIWVHQRKNYKTFKKEDYGPTCRNLLSLFPGEIEKPCILTLADDTIHEEDEELRLVLGSPKSESPFGASIGEQKETLIKIKDNADSKRHCSVNRYAQSMLF